MVAERDDGLFAGLPDLGEVVTQLLDQADEDELRVLAKILALGLANVRVQLLAKSRHERNRPLAHADDFVANRIPHRRDGRDERLPEVVELLRQNLILQNGEAFLTQRPRLRK